MYLLFMSHHLFCRYLNEQNSDVTAFSKDGEGRLLQPFLRTGAIALYVASALSLEEYGLFLQNLFK